MLSILGLFGFGNLLVGTFFFAIEMDTPIAVVPYLLVVLLFSRGLDLIIERWKALPEHRSLRLDNNRNEDE